MSEQETVTATEEVTFDTRFSALIERIQNLSNVQVNQFSREVKSCVSDLRTIQRDVTKEMKKKSKVNKVARRKVERDPNAPPSGFARPVKISDELTAFLRTNTDGMEYTDKKTKTTKIFEPIGDLIARTEVTQRLNAYIGAKDLRKTDDKKFLDLSKEGGAPLRALMSEIPEGADLTYFTMQKYLKHHYIATDSTSTSEAAAPAPTPVVEAPPAPPASKTATAPRTARARRARAA